MIAVIGIAATIATSAWNNALGKWRVTSARQKIDLAIHKTQISAQRNKMNWQFSIRETDAGYVEWSSHAQNTLPSKWHFIGTRAIDIDLADTTLDRSNGSYYVRFDYKGHLASRTRTLTLTHGNVPSVKRCLIMSTLLGEIRQDSEQQQPNSSGRYCY